MFIKPIVAKYNPYCFPVCKMSKISPNQGLRVYLKCKRRDCDFYCKTFIDKQTGRIRLEFRNTHTDLGVEGNQEFCVIRHRPDKRVYILRKYEQERLRTTHGIGNMSTEEVMNSFGLSKKQAKNVRAGVRKKTREDRGGFVENVDAEEGGDGVERLPGESLGESNEVSDGYVDSTLEDRAVLSPTSNDEISEQNRKSVNPSRYYRCNTCGEVFLNEGRLKIHYEVAHHGERKDKNMECPKCGKMYV